MLKIGETVRYERVITRCLLSIVAWRATYAKLEDTKRYVKLKEENAALKEEIGNREAEGEAEGARDLGD